MIITPVRTPFKTIIVIFAVFLLFTVPASLYGKQLFPVIKVLDGDTIVLMGGDRVRLLGVDAPEKGEYLADVSRNWLIRRVEGQDVSLEKCEEKDQYGRILALVLKNGVNINMRLLAEGLAVPMLIPPCGRVTSKRALEVAARALKEKRGLYESSEYSVINHTEADEAIGKKVVVAGRIKEVHRSEKVIHLNFGSDWRTDFTAVIFRGSLERFRALSLDPVDLKGKFVYVIGRVKEYNGPEIIVKWPEQLLPLRE